MIASIINSVAIAILAIAIIKQAKTIKKLKDDARGRKYEINYTNSQKQSDMREDIRRNKQVVESLVDELDMKIEPIELERYTSFFGLYAGPQKETTIIGHKVANITESEKKARELRKELKELVEEES